MLKPTYLTFFDLSRKNVLPFQELWPCLIFLEEMIVSHNVQDALSLLQHLVPELNTHK